MPELSPALGGAGDRRASLEPVVAKPIDLGFVPGVALEHGATLVRFWIPTTAPEGLTMAVMFPHRGGEVQALCFDATGSRIKRFDGWIAWVDWLVTIARGDLWRLYDTPANPGQAAPPEHLREVITWPYD
jgi:hypothetical protein